MMIRRQGKRADRTQVPFKRIFAIIILFYLSPRSIGAQELSGEPPPADEYLEQITQLFAEGEYEAAIAICMQALGHYPWNLDLLKMYYSLTDIQALAEGVPIRQPDIVDPVFIAVDPAENSEESRSGEQSGYALVFNGGAGITQLEKEIRIHALAVFHLDFFPDNLGNFIGFSFFYRGTPFADNTIGFTELGVLAKLRIHLDENNIYPTMLDLKIGLDFLNLSATGTGGFIIGLSLEDTVFYRLFPMTLLSNLSAGLDINFVLPFGQSGNSSFTRNFNFFVEQKFAGFRLGVQYALTFYSDLTSDGGGRIVHGVSLRFQYEF